MPNVKDLLKQTLILCLLIGLNTVAIAQTSRVDELLNQLKKNNPDTVQIKIMRGLSAAYSAVDPIKKFYYANLYRQLAEKNGIDSTVANGYLDMGISYGIRSNVDSALYYFKLGFDKAKQSNYQSGLARAYVNIGYAYDRSERKKDAVKNYEEALKIFRKINSKKGINQCITNLGSIYFDLGEYQLADDYFKQVLANIKETPTDQIGLANALFTLGNSNRKLRNIDQSLVYYRQSLAIREKIGDLNGIALSNWGIALSYIDIKQFNTALPYLDIALKNNRTLKNLYQESLVLMAYADAYIGLKDYEKAATFANLALAKAKESESKGLVSLALEILVDINKAQNKILAADKLQKDFIKVNDSLDVVRTKKEVIISDLQRVNSDNRFLEKRNKTIAAKNSNYITVISITSVSLIVFAILLALYYKRNNEKKAINAMLQKQKQAIAEVNEELIAQMDIVSAQNIELEKLNKLKSKFFSIVSHDLRGPLVTLKTLLTLYRSEDLTQKELGELLIKLEQTTTNTTTFLDNLLEWSKSQLDGMVVKAAKVNIHDITADNIKLMDAQIKLKALKVENHIATAYFVYADPNMVNIVVRNLLSNAIKFCSEGDEIYFNASLNDNNVVFTITDTGPGINENDLANLFKLTNTISTGTAGEKGYHIGLVLCKDMIEQNNGSITVQSKVGQGASFHVTLPVG